MTRPAPRVVEALNAALHRLFEERSSLHLLGEDVRDPYGGAFKVTRGLSTRHPDRVLSTPISEAGITGVAGGLALAGDQAIVEMMFGDFAALAFDQILNLISKSVTMYGDRVPMPVVVRCPVGGNRGYGPTHSQSLQKHFVGVPNLALYETSPFHDPYAQLAEGLDRGPAMLFEDKVLYTRRMFRDGVVDEHHRYALRGGSTGWAHVSPMDGTAADVVLICPGGTTHRALDAARLLRARGIAAHVLVPARLYPPDLEPVLPLLADARLVAVAEESTEGGTWGAEIAARVHTRIWSHLRSPVLQLNSADSVVPTAPHLESRVLLGAERIAAEIEKGAARSPQSRTPAAPPPLALLVAAGSETAGAGAGEQPAAAAGDSGEPAAGVPVAVPKLNNNDTAYLVVRWFADDGAYIGEGDPLVELETSKAVEEIAAPAAGHLRIRAAEGSEVGVGDLLAELLAEPPAVPAPGTSALTPSDERVAAPVPAAVNPTVDPPAQEPAPAARTHVLGRAQQGTAAVVTRAHREVPVAFAAVEVRVDAVLARLRTLSDETGAEVGLPEAVVKAVAAAYPAFPHLFGTLVDERTVRLADTVDIGVTVDAGNGLYIPVLRDCAGRSLADLSDDLMDFRMKAFRAEFTAGELSGGCLSVSLNTEPGVLFVQPIVMAPQLCMVSVGGRLTRLVLEDGVPTSTTVVTLGLAYDHRVVNGRDATAFLRAVADALHDAEGLVACAGPQ
ncbi:2-oxo acid dehydrogenase subunit E2 [Streptomyces griseoincarnatus]|uniref:Dihydrolipoamide acetyltransferase component of pyruvate dehydrogenase complex n=1 Tax=Streptomyces griseoincarnatus TaxID=29305 RepID=A0ABT0VVJ6_STRGI|nr:2-oxo acid dehydrogenase subunit E2 [Streptomyces griseoincarnatus]MCM2515367.1 2-oxo acid dehydrogenase subunit E2 [Streptomyces griseoincarnatus]